MTKFTLTLGAIAVAFGTLALSDGANASALNGSGKSADAPGQEKAADNCLKTVLKQDAKGTTGENTGSENDPKQGLLFDTAVTNCDHLWQNFGAIGPD